MLGGKSSVLQRTSRPRLPAKFTVERAKRAFLSLAKIDPPIPESPVTWFVWGFMAGMTSCGVKKVSGDFSWYHLHLSCDVYPVVNTQIGCIAVLKVMGSLFAYFRDSSAI